MEEEIDLKKFIKMFWDRKWVIFLIIILCVFLGIVYTNYLLKPEYTSTSTIVLAHDTNENINTAVTQSEISLNDKLISTYTALAQSDTVLNETIKSLKLESIYNVDSLRGKVTVTSNTNEQLIKISATDSNPKLAAMIANKITTIFTQKATGAYKINNIRLLSNAEESLTPSNINITKTIVICIVGGFILSVIYIFISNALDNTVEDSKDIEDVAKINVLAEIPLCDFEKKKKELITHFEPKSPVAEVFRALRTNLKFMNKYRECQSILVTSTVQSEGKSWIASNLAVAFAQTGSKTLIIDSDMRRPRQHKIFSIKNQSGLSNYLSNIVEDGRKEELRVSECIVETGVKNLWLLPAGNIPPNPSELLVSSRTEEMINETAKNFDVVIIDGAPCLLVTDSTILSRMVGQTLMVTSSKYTKKDDFIEAKKRIDNVEGNIVGVVLNKVKISGKKYQDNYYYADKKEEEQKEEPKEIVKKEEIKVEIPKGAIEEMNPSQKAKEIVKDIEEYKER